MSKQLTAVEWLEKEIISQQLRYIELSKKDKSKRKEVDAILTATTLLKMKCEQAKEMEREQIIEAVTYGQNNHTVSTTSDIEIAQQYYNETYGNK